MLGALCRLMLPDHSLWRSWLKRQRHAESWAPTGEMSDIVGDTRWSHSLRVEGEREMGMQFQELWSWIRRRKIFASLLVAITLCMGIMIGSLLSGRAQATRAQAS